MCQGLLSCRRYIGKREDPGDEVGPDCLNVVNGGPVEKLSKTKLIDLSIDKSINQSIKNKSGSLNEWTVRRDKK